MCRALRVSPSGYYAWVMRPESEREREDRRLVAHVRAAYAGSRGTYGVRRLHVQLAAEGIDVGRDRLRRLMRHAGLEARPRKRKAWTKPASILMEVPNVLARRFVVDHPDVAWVADTTEFATGEGTLYVAAVLDLYGRRVVGWSASSSMHRALAIDALNRALSDRQPPAGLVHHSDQGSQYTSDDYRVVLDAHGAVASYSGRGQCLDNAVAESFFSTLKTELVHRQRFETHEQAVAALARYIEVFYNHRRRHTRLGYRTPAEHEAKYHQALAAAA